MESSRCSSKTLQKGSCPYAPLDEALRYVKNFKYHIVYYKPGDKLKSNGKCNKKRQFEVGKGVERGRVRLYERGTVHFAFNFEPIWPETVYDAFYPISSSIKYLPIILSPKSDILPRIPHICKPTFKKLECLNPPYQPRFLYAPGKGSFLLFDPVVRNSHGQMRGAIYSRPKSDLRELFVVTRRNPRRYGTTQNRRTEFTYLITGQDGATSVPHHWKIIPREVDNVPRESTM